MKSNVLPLIRGILCEEHTDSWMSVVTKSHRWNKNVQLQKNGEIIDISASNCDQCGNYRTSTDCERCFCLCLRYDDWASNYFNDVSSEEEEEEEEPVYNCLESYEKYLMEIDRSERERQKRLRKKRAGVDV